jgi:hypothetical protein
MGADLNTWFQMDALILGTIGDVGKAGGSNRTVQGEPGSKKG